MRKNAGDIRSQICRAGQGRIASLIGRYYAMDRDNRWDRVEQAYDLLTPAKGEFRGRYRRRGSAGRLRP
ncbi:hypothetical protein IE979_14145 [Klebsiella pneumoniae]|uniref:BPG-independent PGAM N-terminal domain-containing protein n=1 Tax=Klebsiella pneumoniae TaxID=573 RepID=A0A927DPY8_KLEPN|nr:hypothetical protein [Klebsiella pneumoniae]